MENKNSFDLHRTVQVPGDENAKVDHTERQNGQVDFEVLLLDRVLHVGGQAIGEPDLDEHRPVAQRESDRQEQSSALRRRKKRAFCYSILLIDLIVRIMIC